MWRGREKGEKKEVRDGGERRKGGGREKGKGGDESVGEGRFLRTRRRRGRDGWERCEYTLV